MSLLDRLADRICSRHPQRQVLVGIDGPDCAGKTTLCDALADRLAGRRVTVRASLDDHQHPPAVRYRLGRDSPEGCYRDTVDLDAFHREVLQPFRTCQVPNAVLVVDGVFVLRPELAARWDVSVALTIGDDEVLHRALLRDVPRLGTAELVEHRYRTRYLPAQLLYRTEARPADIVLDTTDPRAPLVPRW